EVVKNLYSLLVLDSARPCRQLRDVILQIVANRIVVIANSKAVILSDIEKTVGNEGDTPIDSDWISLRRRVTYSSEKPNSVDHVATLEFLGKRRRVVHNKEILRDIRNCKPALVLKIDRQTTGHRTTHEHAHCLRDLRQRCQLSKRRR